MGELPGDVSWRDARSVHRAGIPMLGRSQTEVARIEVREWRPTSLRISNLGSRVDFSLRALPDTGFAGLNMSISLRRRLQKPALATKSLITELANLFSIGYQRRAALRATAYEAFNAAFRRPRGNPWAGFRELPNPGCRFQPRVSGVLSVVALPPFSPVWVYSSFRRVA